MTSAAERLRCLVPGCRRTVAPPVVDTDAGGIRCGEVICAIHWKLVPTQFKAVYRRATRRLASDTGRQLGAWNRLWGRCRRSAIERSIGL
jgi:hypothetical protein